MKWLRMLGWSAVVVLGTAAIAVLAWSRGEAVSALWMVVAATCVFAVAYRFHAAWLMAKVLTLDETRATPAVVKEDGKDFVRTNRWVGGRSRGRDRWWGRCWRRSLDFCRECCGS